MNRTAEDFWGPTVSITRGDRFIGRYMGVQFDGNVSRIEMDASGYRGTSNDARIWVTLTSPITVSGSERDSIIVNADKVGDNNYRRDMRMAMTTDLRIRRAT